MLRSAYAALAYIVLNTLLLLVGIDLAWAIVHRWRHPPQPLTGVARALLVDYADVMPRVYPGKDPSAIRTLLVDTWSRPYEYEPFTGFRERPFRSRFVNINPAGFRESGRSQPWPPNRDAVFVFGGSTAFGYGVPDDESIPAELERQLQRAGRRDVYNFARASYYSAQEQALFERLLSQGLSPAIAIFVDGFNDFIQTTDEPQFSDDLRRVFNAPKPSAVDYFADFAVVAGVRAILARRHPAPSTAPITEAQADAVIDHYLAHVDAIRAVAASRGVEPIFVWQPVPGDAQPLTQHPFYRHDEWNFGPAHLGYRRARARRREFDAAGIHWCADIVAPATEPMWVDWAHYSATFSRQLVRDCLVPALTAPDRFDSR